MKDLKARVKEFENALPFMEGRDKGDFSKAKEQPLTITDFGFLTDKDDEYVCVIFAEDNDNFYFGGLVLTEQLKELDLEGYGDTIRKDGLPVMFSDRMGKNNRTYTAVKFYPEI